TSQGNALVRDIGGFVRSPFEPRAAGENDPHRDSMVDGMRGIDDGHGDRLTCKAQGPPRMYCRSCQVAVAVMSLGASTIKHGVYLWPAGAPGDPPQLRQQLQGDGRVASLQMTDNLDYSRDHGQHLITDTIRDVNRPLRRLEHCGLRL